VHSIYVATRPVPSADSGREKGPVGQRREDVAVLDRYLAGRYGVSEQAVQEFEPGGGVFRVAGPDLVVRVFPAHRPLDAAQHDARVLELLETEDLPAERLASDEPV